MSQTIEYLQSRKRISDILPSLEGDELTFLVRDEQMTEYGKLEETSTVFTNNSNHRNIILVYMVQNVFDKEKVQRTISLN